MSRTRLSALNYPSPIGPMRIIANASALVYCQFSDCYKTAPPAAELSERHPLLIKAQLQLTEYFAGTRRQFTLPLAPKATPFQTRVWQELQKVSYATTCSYGELALAIGAKNSARAVGMSNGLNPIAIVIPCHRVIGSNGQLTGYAGGLERKQWLLAFERNIGHARAD